MAIFNGVDYVVFILLFISIIIGVVRGFVQEIIALIAWVAAFVVATLFSVDLAALFISPPAQMPDANPMDYIPMAAIIISYLTLFIGVLICGGIIKFIVNYAMEGSGLGVINRLLGAALGLVRGAVIVVLIMFFLTYTVVEKQEFWKDSKMVAFFQPAVNWITVMTRPYVETIEAKMKKTAKSLHEESMPDVIQPKAVPASSTPVVVPAPSSTSAPMSGSSVETSSGQE